MLQYTAIVHRERDWTVIEFPECHGCATRADKNEDVMTMAREALVVWLETHLDEGREVPHPHALVHPPAGASLMPVDIPRALEARVRHAWETPRR